MSFKLPAIDHQKNYSKLNLNDGNLKVIKNRNLKNKNNFDLHTRESTAFEFQNSMFKYKSLKSMNLTYLIEHKPKKKINQPLKKNDKSKEKNREKSLKERHLKIFGKPVFKCSSVKIFPTGSLLKRLTIGSMDEIEKFNYYQNIENTKSYQNYLLKERDNIPQDTINNIDASSVDAVDVVNNDKIIIKKDMDSQYYPSNIIDFFNENNNVKIKAKFKNQGKFSKFLIENYLDNKFKKEKIKEPKENKRYIYLILDGEIIINKNYIKGHLIEIPKFEVIKGLSDEKREKILNDILKKSNKLFQTKKKILSLFSPDKQLITDILEIKKEYKFLYVSFNIICLGLSLVSTPSFLKVYTQKFRNVLKKDEKLRLSDEHKDNEIIKKIKNKFKIKAIINGIKPKKEKNKYHYSFAEGENEIINEEYIIYSDNEERKSPIEKKILNYCNLKNDFFLYLNKESTDKKINELKTKLVFNEDKAFDIRESYKKFDFDFNKIIEKYKKQIQKLLKINPKIYEIDQIQAMVDSHNLLNPKEKMTKLFINKNTKKIKKLAEKKQINIGTFYHYLDQNVTKYYTPFILYNIPKLLSEFKNYTRHRLFEMYTLYKDLVALSYSKYKSDFILQNGIDFETFWYCTEELSDEKKKFVEKIYNQINSTKLCALNMKDFIKGMYFIQNTDITEKLDLFLKALDLSGKGKITYKEAVEICKDSIQRNLSSKKELNVNNEFALNELSNFFAKFIFKLIGVEISQFLCLDDLKKAILSKGNEFNEIKYLEMFCGAKK